MKEIKILIADDEARSRNLLSLYLSKTKISCTLIEAHNGDEANMLIEKEHPDILFLDINMPGMTGIEILKSRVDKAIPAVILTTAFAEYALTSYDFDIIDYLLKPFDYERLLKAVNKAVRYLRFLESSGQDERPRHFIIKNGIRNTIVNARDIMYFMANGAYVKIASADHFYLIKETLQQIEGNLPGDNFIRIHRSFIVNVNFIKEIRSLLNGDYSILLSNGDTIRASRTFAWRLKSALGNF